MPEVDSDEEEYLSTVDLGDPVCPEEPVLDSWGYLCIHKIPRIGTPPPQPNQGVSVTPPPQPDQIEMSPDYKLMELNIPEDII